MKKNLEIAALFNQLADILEIRGELPFKVSAYRKAARTLENLDKNVEEIFSQTPAQKIPGIGEGLEKKIREYLETGKISKLEEEKKKIPVGLVDLLSIPGLGPKTIAKAADKLGVKNITDLKRVIENGSLTNLFGLGKKKVEGILKGIQFREKQHGRITLREATEIANEIIEYMKKGPKIKEISPAGSLRRKKETIGDIDTIVAAKDGEKIIQHFCNFPGTSNVIASGTTKGSILIESPEGSRQVDLRVVAPAEFGSALQYFTGSKEHNIKIRNIAKQKGLKISEYGVFRDDKKIAGKKEEEVYEILGLRWIPPELREDRGEIEASGVGGLPELVELSDIKGDLHIHSNFSDGNSSIEEIVKKAVKLGYSYVAITDHSVSVKYANGLEPERLEKQWEEISRVQRNHPEIRILKGTEVDILSDGKLDYPDSLLEKLDWVIAAIHQGFKKNVTERIIFALRNPHVNAVAHPTGRLLSRREGYEVDIDKVIEEAGKLGKCLELNSYYDRLDLSDQNLMKAKKAGVKIAIGTDSHDIAGLNQMQFGVGTARRGWLEKKDIINCFETEALEKFLKSKKAK